MANSLLATVTKEMTHHLHSGRPVMVKHSSNPIRRWFRQHSAVEGRCQSPVDLEIVFKQIVMSCVIEDVRKGARGTLLHERQTCPGRPREEP